ncbi:ATP-dependent helicase [Anaerosporobacter sp.]|uniref:ATP-dependent helicase n=1 Tax=Anaerosporobacter sp. TaxID=1872529 RepID=UPI00286EDD60|nr:UvrD-helicase domain-containing protein [Anaerosporobacter sp.]
MSIYDTLNPQQLEAVKHNKGPLLILAGAGSGKTRVLTHRIAYLIDELDVNPWNILAITFTNKAAREMRERVDNIVGYGSENIWVSTFHSTCVRVLRRYIDYLGYDKNFTIYDTDDQKTLVRDVCKFLNIDTKTYKERTLLSVISSAKNELISAERYEREAQGDLNKSKYASVYKEYQKRLKQNNALDFDDLLFKAVELFENYPDALEYYQRRFKYIMVDEYQDTNTVQFKLISILASGRNEEGEREHNLCVVGDDDQSIYKFRGANIYNILNFEKQFPATKVIKLEQNYRSTSNILDAANEVIHNNLGRKDKRLWTANGEGELLSFTQFDTEYEEANEIVSDMYNLILNDGHDYNEFAILYRTNAQSRIFEEKLILRNIPYKIVGGINFYQRKEIKDILAYLKTIDNGLDDIAVKRIINIPRRGIGLTTIDRVTDYAIGTGMSFYAALKRAESIPGLGRGMSKISPFVSLIEVLKSKMANPEYSLEDLINEILEATGYLSELEAEDTEESQARIENINELINKVVSYEKSAQEEPSLSGFLEEVALVADIDNLEESNNVVVLMTLHAAKGLEFPYVYLCGMEEGVFPSYMCISSDDPTDIEEERRLCYVGITRAMTKLYLSAARQRMVRGETQFNRPSRFINEIPRYLLNQASTSSNRYSAGSSSPFSNTQAKTPFYGGGSTQKGGTWTPPTGTQSDKNNIFANNPFISKGFGTSSKLGDTTFDKPKPTKAVIDYSVGDTVKHPKFGVGIVAEMSKQGDDYIVSVDFDTSGMKKMKASFAKLIRL